MGWRSRIRRGPHALRRGVLLGALALLPALTAVSGQESSGVRVVISRIAGATLYVDAGSDSGIETGDTVTVAREPGLEVAGRLVVLSAATGTAVLAFAEDPFVLTRGETLILSSPGISAARNRTEEVAPAPDPRQRTTPTPRPGPRVRGQIGLDVDVVNSRTEYGSGPDQAVERTNATPVLRLNTTITGLPAGLSLEVAGRGSYRYASLNPLERPTSLRLYSASLEKRFADAPVHVRAGRFYNRYESYSGYWDGAMVRVGGRSGGVGVVAGFQPDRWNQGFTTDLPKLSVFGDFSARGNGTSYAGDVSMHRVQPQNGLPDHTFVGLSQRVRVDRWRFSQDLQVDRNPEGGGWEVTRFNLNGSLHVSDGVDVRAGLSRRRTYRLWDSVSVIDFARDRLMVGVSVRAGAATIGGDVAAIRGEDGQVGPSYTARFFVPAIGPLGVTASASYWKGEDYEVISLLPGAALTFGRTRIDAGYRYYRSDYDSRGFLTHSVRGGASVSLNGGFRYSLTAVTQWGEGLRSNRLYSGFSKSFR